MSTPDGPGTTELAARQRLARAILSSEEILTLLETTDPVPDARPTVPGQPLEVLWFALTNMRLLLFSLSGSYTQIYFIDELLEISEIYQSYIKVRDKKQSTYIRFAPAHSPAMISQHLLPQMRQSVSSLSGFAPRYWLRKQRLRGWGGPAAVGGLLLLASMVSAAFYYHVNSTTPESRGGTPRTAGTDRPGSAPPSTTTTSKTAGAPIGTPPSPQAGTTPGTGSTAAAPGTPIEAVAAIATAVIPPEAMGQIAQAAIQQALPALTQPGAPTMSASQLAQTLPPAAGTTGTTGPATTQMHAMIREQTLGEGSATQALQQIPAIRASQTAALQQLPGVTVQQGPGSVPLTSASAAIAPATAPATLSPGAVAGASPTLPMPALLPGTAGISGGSGIAGIAGPVTRSLSAIPPVSSPSTSASPSPALSSPSRTAASSGVPQAGTPPAAGTEKPVATRQQRQTTPPITTLARYRDDYPGMYDDVDDWQLAQALHARFYSHIPYATFAKKVGLSRDGAEALPPVVTLEQYRAQHASRYDDLTDDDLAHHIHQTFYATVPWPVYARLAGYADPSAMGAAANATTSERAAIEQAIATRNYRTAFRQALRFAQAGDPWAQFITGYLLASGYGVTENAARAVIWYTHAARQGHGLAQFNLGTLLASGAKGVTPDPDQAIHWLTAAARQRIDGAEANLAAVRQMSSSDETVSAQGHPPP
jgi:hypothetical protein